MTKKLFVETIAQIKKQFEYDSNIVSYLGKVFPCVFEANLFPVNHFLENQLIKILQIETGDSQTNESWIEYFIFELNFGGNYCDECAMRKDGSKIDLSTSGKLYDFLME